MSIEQNYNDILKKINEAILISNDPGRTIELIAVTKTIPISRMKEALEVGLHHFGENKVQEITEKINIMDDRIKWHMIGHLQRNKVKYIVDKVTLIHSVDSISLFNEINRRGVEINRRIDCLIQVNVSGEDTKFGLSPEDLHDTIRSVEGMKSVNIKGLMTMAPHYDDPEKTRDCFKALNELYHTCKEKKYPQTSFQFLSMGMSNDYEIAVQEGSNMIRVGSALFGERNYG